LENISDGDGYFLPTWDNWERFNAYFRCLKSQCYPPSSLVSFTNLHHGMELNCKPFNFVNQHLNYCVAVHQEKTSSSLGANKIKTQNGIYKVSDCMDFFLGTGNSSSGDGWCGLEIEPKQFLREIHQYKFVHTSQLSLDDIKNERQKAADENDLFLLFTIDTKQWSPTELPENTGIVSQPNFKQYYGPFAGRVYLMTTKPLNLDINTLHYHQLKYFPGIGDKRATTIVEERRINGPYESIEDLQRRTKIPLKLIKSFKVRREKEVDF